MISISSIYQAQKKAGPAEQDAYMQLQKKALDEWAIASPFLEIALVQIEAVCDEKLAKEFDMIARVLRTVLYQILNERDLAALAKMLDKIDDRIKAVLAAARTELGIERSQTGT